MHIWTNRMIARCRNVCAHGERLYSFRINEAILDMTIHQKMRIQKKRGQYSCEKNDLFAVVIALRYLIDNEEYAMGFPANWDKITRYKKYDK